MEWRDRIREALKRKGYSNILSWAAEQPTLSLVKLRDRLGADVAPVNIELFMEETARQQGSYGLLLRSLLVRCINEYFPNGYGASERKDYVVAAAFAMWSRNIGIDHREEARALWKACVQHMRDNSMWVPKTPDDPILVGLFAAHPLAPSVREQALAEAISRLDQIIRVNNHPFSREKAHKNLQGAPRGFAILFAVSILDGQVCNGGFVQYYGNTGGREILGAIEGLRAIGMPQAASITEESFGYALKYRRDLLVPEIGDVRKYLEAYSEPRDWESLDQEWYALYDHDISYAISCGLADFVVSQPEWFGGDI